MPEKGEGLQAVRPRHDKWPGIDMFSKSSIYISMYFLENLVAARGTIILHLYSCSMLLLISVSFRSEAPLCL